MKLSKLLLATSELPCSSARSSEAPPPRDSPHQHDPQIHVQGSHFAGAFGNIVCQVTLEGSLHSRTITKIVAP